MDTGLEAPGLGCGQDIQPRAGGTTTPQCWLVVVPEEHPDRREPGQRDQRAAAWSPRPLTPTGVGQPHRHPPAASTRSGPAARSTPTSASRSSAASWPPRRWPAWQPALCSLPGTTPSATSRTVDDQARQNLTNPPTARSACRCSPTRSPRRRPSPPNPVVYAPLTLSGVVVAFNIERDPVIEPDGNLQPQELALSGRPGGAPLPHPPAGGQAAHRVVPRPAPGRRPPTRRPPYAWVQNNPASLFTDPDFLQYNPEFSCCTSLELQRCRRAASSRRGTPTPPRPLWKWVLSDPEAKAWLDAQAGSGGGPGHERQPVLQHQPAVNPSGVAFGSRPRRTIRRAIPTARTPARPSTGPAQATSARPLASWTGRPTCRTCRPPPWSTGAANDGANDDLQPDRRPPTWPGRPTGPRSPATTSSCRSPTRRRRSSTACRRPA